MVWYAVLAKIMIELFAWLFQSVTPRVLEGAGPGELEKTLRERLKEQGW